MLPAVDGDENEREKDHKVDCEVGPVHYVWMPFKKCKQ